MTIETFELDQIAYFDPDESADSPLSDQLKPRLTNRRREQETNQVIQVYPIDILSAIKSKTDGWPKCAAGELAIMDPSGQLKTIKKETEFFAWLHDYFEIEWATTNCITKNEFFEFCKSHADQYVDIADHPHFPPIDKVLYHHQQPVIKSGTALDKFLDFFDPATDRDRELIKALLLTFFWGGKPGQRPAFIITTNDDNGKDQGRGYGKTALLEKCSALCGGMLSFSKDETIENVKKRILNQANKTARPRVIAFDNVKTRRFSDADLESLITSKDVSGQVLYSGNGVVPNLHTIVITINGANLSKDLAQRCMVIELGQSVHSPTWSEKVEDFIKNHKWSIIGKIGELLQSTGNPLQEEGTTRWGSWEYGVLSKVNNPSDVRKLIKNRQSKIDDDASNSEEFIQEILDHLKHICYHQNRNIKAVEIIQQDSMVEILKGFLGKHIASNIVAKTISSMGLPCLKQVVEKGRSRYWIFRLDGQKLTPEQLEAGSQSHHDWPTIDLTDIDNLDGSYNGVGQELTLEEIEDESPNHHDWLNTIDLTESDNQDDESYDGEGQNLTLEEIEAGSPNHVDWLTRYLTNSDNQDEGFYDWEGQDLTTEEIEAGSPNHHAWLNPIDLPDGDNQDDEFPD